MKESTYCHCTTTNNINGKKTVVFILVIALLLFFSACGSDSSGAGLENTKVVSDCLGREVHIPEKPENVTVLYASTAHMMAMLDEGEKIVAAPRGVKSDELMIMKYPDITHVPTPAEENSINIEELANLNTDLALIRRSTFENEGETEKLDKLNIPYLVVDYESIAELKEAVLVMGQVFDKNDRASEYIDFLEKTIDMVVDNIADVSKADYPNVYHSVNEAIRTDSDNDICMEIMELSGVKNAASGKNLNSEDNKNYTTLEEIYNWEPYAIIANEYSVTEYILSDSKWSGLSCVKSGRVYTLPVGATRWCHPGSMEVHMGVLAVADMFHPNEMGEIDMKEYTKDYYKEFFDLELEDELIEKILSGKGMRLSNSPG